VLRDSACGAGQAARRRADGRGRAAVLLPAVARSLPSEVDPLPGLDLQARARRVRRELPRARLPGAPARDRHLHQPRKGVHGALLRVLRADAVLHTARAYAPGSGEGHEVSAPSVAGRRFLGAALAAASLLLAGAATAQHAAFELEPANHNIANTASLQRGAKYFVNYCLGCHSAQYVRYNRLARDLQLTEDQLISNLMFTGEQVHDTMSIAMRSDDATRWFGTTPPDLSLIARARGTDYIYTFLRSFYEDPSSQTGADNLVLPNTAMPHVLWELQGIRRAVFTE